MKIMNCPLNGPRNISEFAYGGEVKPVPAAAAASQDWADYVYYHDNQPGIVREWWLHVPTSYWFVAVRDVTSDKIIATYRPDEAPS
ncbi:MAG: sarcosine oxidase subunit delta [Rhodospirillales bacterium]|nr:sarcosine oxidase subunit delta [Rhodospirillales bacterium]